MAQVEYIKFLYEKKEESFASIARKIGVDWRTVKKYATNEDWNKPVVIKPKKSIMAPYTDIVDTWLMEDALRPRKQRRTRTAIFKALRDDYGNQGSDRTVRSFVNERKRVLKIQEEKFIEIRHIAGTAQADFGTTTIIIESKMRDISVLHLSFPHSNAGFFISLPTENQECSVLV